MPEPTSEDFTRRELIQSVLGFSGAWWATAVLQAAGPAKPNLIQEENCTPGSLDWQLTRVRLDKTTGFRSPWIEGYCSHQSVQAGDTLQLMISTTPVARFKI